MPRTKKQTTDRAQRMEIGLLALRGYLMTLVLSEDALNDSDLARMTQIVDKALGGDVEAANDKTSQDA